MNLAALVVAGMMALGGGAEPSVSGSGQQIIKAMPDTIEMTINLEATDEKFDKALAAIQQQDADLERALRGLPTAPVDLKSEGPWHRHAPRPDRTTMLTRQMMQAVGRAAPEDTSEGKVTLSVTVTARWKLTARESLALLKETEALQEAVRGVLAKPPEAAATEDQVEAMLAAAGRASATGEPSGTPSFSFTATIPADKAAEAKAQAFKKARADAESLAQAAGMKLGALRSLSGSSTPETPAEPDDYLTAGPKYPAEEEGVARSIEARELSMTVHVDLEFDMAPGQ